LRTIDDLLDYILSSDCAAEIRVNKTSGISLIVKPEIRLSSHLGEVIRSEGFRFKYSYSGLCGKPVIIFSKQQ